MSLRRGKGEGIYQLMKQMMAKTLNSANTTAAE